jgi:predicted ester cyclase
MSFDSKALMRTYLEEVVRNDRVELIDELAHSDVVDEANQAFGGPPGRAGLIAHVKGFGRNIGNAEVTVKRIVGDEHAVMAWWSFTGIHVGPWLGHAPTGRAITSTVFSFFDISDERISRYSLWLHAGFGEPVIFDSTISPPR